MKFAVGYQLYEPDEEPFSELVAEFQDSIREVYFPWPAWASGRSPIGGRDGKADPAAVERFEADLEAMRGLGVRLDLLLNANCYGGAAMSRDLARDIDGILDRLTEVAGGADVVTTTSPAIATMVRRLAPDIETRASVNMRIGTVQGMRQLAELFDSFHVQRDYNRDLEHLAELKSWADLAGKTLHLLANSGCLRFCGWQTFHDNLVAHETAVAAADNIEDFLPYGCWNLLKDRGNWAEVLRATWIRPEDLHHYEDRGLFHQAKLATRLHQRPDAVIRAYATGRFAGNLLDLFEPGYSPAFAPYVVDNTRFPSDWFDHVTAHSCWAACDPYYERVLERVLVDLAGTP